MTRVAVIGSGIAGLTAAYYLSQKHEVHLFERDSRIGGHTHTHLLESSRGPIAVDTGFIVHNERTYPNFIRLMGELGVETAPSDMSFAVTSPDRSFESSSRGLAGFFAQQGNWLRPAHYGFLLEIMRFNREAPKLLDNPEGGAITLGEFLDRGGYTLPFIERYLIPMAGAVWSMSPTDMAGFPALTLIQFMRNHGMLGLNTHPQWKVIRGGSSQYLRPLTEPFRSRIETNVEILSVERNEAGVELRFEGRPSCRFDDVVFACHGDQILPMLAKPTEDERRILGAFTTSRNETCLHTDSTLLPQRPAARASWNYLLGDSGKVTVTYHMNRLQSLDTAEDFCVTLNANGHVNPSQVRRRMVYEHPMYTRAAVRSQESWNQISGRNRTHFCGAYWFYGFHEDGVRSGMRVAETLGVDCS